MTRTDMERMEWIEANQPTLSYAMATDDGPAGPHVCTYEFGGHRMDGELRHFYGDTFRAAIDAAMEAKP